MNDKLYQEIIYRLKNIERILKIVSSEKRKPDWITATMLSERTGYTKEQVRGLRFRYPNSVKEKPVGYKGMKEDGRRSVRYLYNWTELQNHCPRQS